MSDTVMIPFVNPVSEILEAYPFKLIVTENHLEIYSRYRIIEDDEDKGMKQEVSIDSIETISKSAIDSLIYGKSIKHPQFLLKIKYGNDDISFWYEDKTTAKDLYLKLKLWRYANS